jgi:tryptophanyl-tRNA synthetase
MTNIIPNFISNAESIVNIFGYWPTFHDDILEELKVSSTNSCLIMTITSKQIKNKVATIIITLKNIQDLKVSGFQKNCNIINNLSFREDDQDLINIKLSPSVGLGLEVKCKEVLITEASLK